ncbi:phenylacetaldoxime dehydratase family protein [Amycolatopsis sp. NPDC051372]|uniref:phenylacetaldoxime dehydratase family protein n=1 Tax=unclassified Amycolatopsis TaxID=2618356 RepID=UPI00343B5E89
MAYLGVQYRTPQPPPMVVAALAALDSAHSGEHAPDHHDRARFVDEAGYATVLTTFYWTDPAEYDRWAKAREAWTGPQHEHDYWGGARDRLPIAQTDRLEPGSRPTAETDPETGVVTVSPRGNLCLIRSGQEWTETEGDERGMYLGDVEPVLRAGMEFLRDDGLGIGCYANRYVRVTDDTGAETDKSYGMSWWHSLADLEAWAESHPTHVAIFRAAMKYLSTQAPAARLRLYHEVTVTDAGEQEFRYLGCHDRTGLLSAVR